MLEKKLGIKGNDKKKKKIHSTIDMDVGTGFMDFLDDIGKKIKIDPKQYKPQEYIFSDDEGIEEKVEEA